MNIRESLVKSPNSCIFSMSYYNFFDFQVVEMDMVLNYVTYLAKSLQLKLQAQSTNVASNKLGPII